MLKKLVRLGILAMLAVIIGISTAGVGVARVEAISNPRSIIQGTMSYGDVYGVQWNGSYDSSTWDVSNLYTLNFVTQAKTFGGLQAEYESKLGYPIVMLAKIPQFPALNSIGAGVGLSSFSLGVISGTYTYLKPDPSDLITKYFSFPYDGLVFIAIFKAPVAKEEVIRLSLYGYVSNDNHSCVLWSLDSSRPNNVNKACGMDVELVCKIKLVDKELKYNCNNGYDWLGEQIVHDPKWLSWADKFASMNGRK